MYAAMYGPISQGYSAEHQHVRRADEVVAHDEQQYEQQSDDAVAPEAPPSSPEDAQAKHHDEAGLNDEV